MVTGVLAQAGRQIGARRIDRRLHVARGTVEAAVEAKLQCDIGTAVCAPRGHLGDVGNDAETAFERCCHGRRHCVGAGSRNRRRYRNGRVIDLRKARHRQPQKGESPDERDADRQQRRCDRPSDERRRRVHFAAPPGLAPPPEL